MTQEQHDAFHRYLGQRGYPKERPDVAADMWQDIPDFERRQILHDAADIAGLDTSDPNFQKALNEAMEEATKGGTHGWPQKWSRCKKVYKVRPRSGGKAVKLVRGASKALDRAYAVGKGMAVVGGVLHGMQMLDSLRIDNPFVLELALISRRAMRTGELSIMDEVSAFDDLYQLTGDPFSAAYAWDYWRESIGQ